MDGDSDNRMCHFRLEHHQPMFVSFLNSVLLKESFADVTLVSEDLLQVKAHRIVLSAFSSYFEEVLERHPCKHPIIILKDVQSSDLQAIVNFLYKGETSVDVERVHEIKKIAGTLRLKGLVESEVHSDSCTRSRSRATTESYDISSPNQYLRTPSPSPSKDSVTTSVQNMVKIQTVKSDISHSSSSSVSGNNTTSSYESVKDSDDTDETNKETSSSSSRKGSNSTNVKIQSSFVSLGVKKKKEAWLDLDALQRKNTKKRYRQPSIIFAALNLPTPKVDITKQTDYNGGVRSSSQTTTVSDSLNEKGAKSTKAGTKRKSDDSVEGATEKCENTDSRSSNVSEACFDTSPSKESTDGQCSSPSILSHQSSTKKSRSHKPLSPLSPVKMNIIKTPELASPISKTKPTKSGNEPSDDCDSTIAILRDYDKVPTFHSRSPVKVSQGKKDRQELKCTCGQGGSDLDGVVDQKDLSFSRSNCPVHSFEDPEVQPFNTPEHYWSTVQYTTQQLYEDGHINIGTPFTPPPRRRKRNSNETYIDTDTENDLF